MSMAHRLLTYRYVDPAKVTIAAAAATSALHAFQGQVGPLCPQVNPPLCPQVNPPLCPQVNPLLPNAPAFPGGVPGIASGGLPPGISFTAQPTTQPTAQLLAPLHTLLPSVAPLLHQAVIPTQCLCVSGMVGADVLSNDQDFGDVRGLRGAFVFPCSWLEDKVHRVPCHKLLQYFPRSSKTSSRNARSTPHLDQSFK